MKKPMSTRWVIRSIFEASRSTSGRQLESSCSQCLVLKDGFLFWAKEARQSEIEALRKNVEAGSRLGASLDLILRVIRLTSEV